MTENTILFLDFKDPTKIIDHTHSEWILSVFDITSF